MTWIPVDQALPIHHSDIVLVWPRDDDDPGQWFAVYCWHRDRFESYEQDWLPSVTHWMPLPPGPQDGSGQGCQPPVKDAKDAIKDANRKRDSR